MTKSMRFFRDSLVILAFFNEYDHKYAFSMRRLLIIILLSCMGSAGLFAGTGEPVNDARSTALGGSSLFYSGPFSSFQNAANLALLPKMAVGLNVGNKFQLGDIRNYSLGFALPTRSGTFALGIFQEGIPAFKESRIALAYGRMLTEDLYFGVDFDLLNINIENHGSTSAFTFGLGLNYKISKNIVMAAHVFNPLNSSWTSAETDRVPAIIRLGAQYKPSEKVSVQLEVEKNNQFSAQFKGGIWYEVLENFQVGGGISTSPSAFHFGFQFEAKEFSIGMANMYHPTLGHSPQLTLVYAGVDKNKKK